jgi:hypothetical protein
LGEIDMGNMFAFEWVYLVLKGGRLCDDEGDANTLWPSFASVAEANAWLEEQDVRATCR